MQIFLQPPNPEALSFEIDFQIQQAIAALRRSSIRIQGAGRFGDGLSGIVLQRDADLPAARAALEKAGIRVADFTTPGPPLSGPRQQATPKKVIAGAAGPIRPHEHRNQEKYYLRPLMPVHGTFEKIVGASEG